MSPHRCFICRPVPEANISSWNSSTFSSPTGWCADPGEIVRIDYINYRGERAIRRVVPGAAATWAR